jgi:uracil-DNA glycosylase
MKNQIKKIRESIRSHDSNERFLSLGYEPLFVADERARIVIVGQAPGINAQELGKPWADLSGERLISWLGIDEALFRDESKISLLPMDFYYQGRAKSGDLPPRRGFAALWHPKLLALMPNIKLTVLAGQYAVKEYLGAEAKANLTETVRTYKDYLPKVFPIVHPSPLNNRWLAKNPWFLSDVIPALQKQVKRALR